jgi:glucokinase
MTIAVALLGDVGGTNTRLGVLLPHGMPGQISTFRNADFASFEQLLLHYLSAQDVQSCAAVILAIAAPINGDIIGLTNCAWQIDTNSVCSAAKTKNVRFINDLEALALCLDRLPANAVTHIAGPHIPTDALGRKLVIGVGTGFNAACAMRSGSVVVLPAECGHMTLPVETAEGLHLRDHLAKSRGRASVERALSGQGLTEVYQWVAASRGLVPKDLTAAQITHHAIQNADPCCMDAAIVVLRILATVCGDLALAYLPHGGVYLAGSVARALAPLLAASGFAAELTRKGRQTGLLQSFSVHLITKDAAALIGCATLACPHPEMTMELSR